MNNGADTIKAAMEAMANVKKMDIDPKTGRVLSRANKSILEDVYEKSGAVIPVEVKKIVEDKKESLAKTVKPVKDTVAAYYAMIQGKPKDEILKEETIQQKSPLDNKISIEKLPNEEAYMQMLVKAINKKR